MGKPEGPTPFSENDIDRWAAEAESDRAYAGGHLALPAPVRRAASWSSVVMAFLRGVAR